MGWGIDDSEMIQRLHNIGIKGKRLKLLLLALQDLGLLPKERIAKKFHDCCKNEFDWDIARYSAMNDYKYNDKQKNNNNTRHNDNYKTVIIAIIMTIIGMQIIMIMILGYSI